MLRSACALGKRNLVVSQKPIRIKKQILNRDFGELNSRKTVKPSLTTDVRSSLLRGSNLRNDFRRYFHFTRSTWQNQVKAFTYEEPVGASLIPMVNKLQEVCSLIGENLIDLPQIVVIGSQSSGKSSVLENLVGRDFLPRGADLVTRRPLVLQLHKLPDSSATEWGEFLHKPGKKFSFEELKREIEEETERVTGKNKGISSQPILLKIYSPNVLANLTLVDTPGMTRVPVGDQPVDIEQRIRDIIFKFIAQPNAIVLAVQSATADLATSDALKLSREVDLEGNRTIGVLTKLDIMDKGTNAMDVLTGKTIPLKLGFVPIVNRSQYDIQMGKSIQEMLKDEANFFKNHPVYWQLADRAGSAFLAAKCNKLLSNHIQKVLPSLKNQIRNKLKDKQEELQAYGSPVGTDKTSQGWLLLHLLNHFSDNFKNAIDGVPDQIDTSQLNGGARIRYIFHDTFGKHLESVDPLEGLTTNDIKTAIRNASGTSTSLFVPEKAFELLVKRQIELLREPSMRVAETVFDELLRIVTQLDTRELGRFPTLRQKVIDIVNSTLRHCLKPTMRMVTHLVDGELAYINSNHESFMGGANLLRTSIAEQVEGEPISDPKKDTSNKAGLGFLGSLFGSKKEEPPKPKKLPEIPNTSDALNERDIYQIKLLRQLIRSYFKIVQKNLQENVPKAVMLFLVHGAKEAIHRDLMAELYKEELFDSLLFEDPTVASKRKAAAEQFEALKQAKQIIQDAELQLLSK